MEEVPESVRKAEKATIKHLYKIVGKLNPANFSKYDFLMNFGVSIDSKVKLQKAVENACDYEEFKGYVGKSSLYIVWYTIFNV